MIMDSDLARRLSKEHEYYWRPILRDLPDAWVSALLEFWQRLDEINTATPPMSDRRYVWVALRYDLFPAGLTAYASPAVNLRRWTPAHAMALIAAIDEFHQRLQETCEQCGSRTGYRHKTQLDIGGYDRILCEQCGQKWEGNPFAER